MLLAPALFGCYLVGYWSSCLATILCCLSLPSGTVLASAQRTARPAVAALLTKHHNPVFSLPTSGVGREGSVTERTFRAYMHAGYNHSCPTGVLTFSAFFGRKIPVSKSHQPANRSGTAQEIPCAISQRLAASCIPTTFIRAASPVDKYIPTIIQVYITITICTPVCAVPLQCTLMLVELDSCRLYG